MEILVGRSNTVSFSGEPGWSAMASWTRGIEDQGPLPVTESDGEYLVTIPFLMEEEDIAVQWTFGIPGLGVVERTQKFQAATPLLSQKEVKSILGTNDSIEADKAEASVRFVINSHTGQEFGRYRGTKQIRPSNSEVLFLPTRLISITNINGVDTGGDWEIVSDGFGLRKYMWGTPPVKADFYNLHQHVGGVIHNPNNVSLSKFNASMPYNITGLWGYESPPEQVVEAARLLLGVYSDPDTEYRDRFLTSMTAADWRIQHHNGAFIDTGHVRANQLLAPYVLRRGWVVL